MHVFDFIAEHFDQAGNTLGSRKGTCPKDTLNASWKPPFNVKAGERIKVVFSQRGKPFRKKPEMDYRPGEDKDIDGVTGGFVKYGRGVSIGALKEETKYWNDATRNGDYIPATIDAETVAELQRQVTEMAAGMASDAEAEESPPQ